jgi:hypothetical protein
MRARTSRLIRRLSPPLFAGAGSGFTDPLTFWGADLVQWFKADALVYNDNGSTLATDGQTVRRWKDSSSYGYDIFQQDTPTQRPTFQDPGSDGHRAVQFIAAVSPDGDVLYTENPANVAGGPISAVNGATAFSVFVRMRMTNNTQSIGRIFSYASMGAGHDWTSGAEGWSIQRDGTSDAIAFVAANTTLTSTAVSLDTELRFGVVCGGGTVTPYLNNVAGTPGSFTPDFTHTDGAMSLGSWVQNWGSSYFDGEIIEVVFLKKALDATERGHINTWFQRTV